MGSIVVSPHKSPDDYGPGMPLGPMKVVKSRGGVVRIGHGDGSDGVTVLGWKFVSVAPAFDPLAVSMVPLPGWHPPAALPVHAVRRGPGDAAVDMLSGPGWILPRATAVALGLVA